MDLSGVLTIPNILLVTVAILTGLYFYGRRNFGFFTESGLKCPEPTAFLGNMIEMSRKGLDQVLFDWQKECGDTYGVFFGNHPSFVSANPEIIEEITVKDFAKFRNRYNAPTLNEYAANMISHATDDHWKYLRTVLAPAYTSKRMREMVPLLEDVLETFDKNLNKIADSKEATNVDILFSGYTMDVIASTGFGIKARKDVLQLMLDAQLKGHEKLEEETEQELKLENVTDWRTKRGLTDVEIIAQCLLFLLAGFETTSTTLGFFSHAMATNPDIQEKLCKEIEEQLGQESPNYDNVQKLTYLDMCMDETLRLYPTAGAFTRLSREDCIIKGMKIPKYTAIMVPVRCLHYDRRYWTEPEKFHPEHFSEENKAKQTPFTYLPFGAGPRMCAGMRLAKLEFKMAVVHMLRKFCLVACEKTEEKIEFSKVGLLKPQNGIWIKIEHR